MSQTKSFIAYTDGGCDGNGTKRAVGGWGVVVIEVETGIEHELRSVEPHLGATNNEMEILAILKALKFIDARCPEGACIEIRGDSQVALNWAQGTWRCRATNACPVYMRRIHEITPRHDVVYTWVKGHAGNKYNERADRLAAVAIEQHLGRTMQHVPGWVEAKKRKTELLRR